MSLVSEDARRLQELLRHLKPTMDAATKDIKPIEKVTPLVRRDMAHEHPMIPNLVNLTEEEKSRFQDSVGMIYLANLVNLTMQIYGMVAQGEFIDAITAADMIWVAYPDLAPYLDQEPPSEVVKKRVGDFVNYTWSKYTGSEVDDSMMFSTSRKYYITDEKYAELAATRERAIQREYLMFEFLQKVHLGMRELGWLLSEEHRLSLPGGDEIVVEEEETEESATEEPEPEGNV